MLHRRSSATAALLTVLLAAALSSCGFDYPTDRINTIAAGANNRDGTVDVLGARVLAYADGDGRLIGTLVNNNNDAEEPARLLAVEGDSVTVDVPRTQVPGNGRVNLAAPDAAPITVTGDFAAGGVVTLTYRFDTGESVESVRLDVPVVKNCFQYTEVPSPEPSEVAEPEAEEESPTAEETESEAHAEGEASDNYLCIHPTEQGEH